VIVFVPATVMLKLIVCAPHEFASWMAQGTGYQYTSVRVVTSVRKPFSTSEESSKYKNDRFCRRDPYFERRFRFDLIAMATHGRSGLSQLLAGSVANRVLERAGRPVLLVRPSDLATG